jgi:hypothetical protein
VLIGSFLPSSEDQVKTRTQRIRLVAERLQGGMLTGYIPVTTSYSMELGGAETYRRKRMGPYSKVSQRRGICEVLEWTIQSSTDNVRLFFFQTNRSAAASTDSRTIRTWRPLHTVFDAPLAICDPGTLSKNDLITITRVGPEQINHISCLKHKPQHRFYYLREQRPEELLLFRTWDSENDRISVA